MDLKIKAQIREKKASGVRSKETFYTVKETVNREKR